MLTVQFNSTLRLGYISRLRHSSAAIERLKNPPRGGQNLSERYQRLERSLRGKEVLVKELGELAPRLASNYGENSQSHAIKMSSSLPPKKKDVEMFHGLEVPQEPREPQSEGVSDSHIMFLHFCYICCLRMLYVGMCGMCIRPLRGIHGCISRCDHGFLFFPFLP